MEEKKKLKITANKKIITFSLIALASLMLVSTSYAYFTAVITGNDTAKKTTIVTGTMSLKLTGNTEVGMSSVMPGESTTITFRVENTGTLATTYSLTMDQVTNNFADKNDLVYTITSTNNGGSKTETVIPSSNGILIPVVSIEPKVTQEYTMTITFKETNDIQNDNQGKAFTGRVQIEEANKNLLAAKILSDNILQTAAPVWGYESVDKGLYKESGEKTLDGNPTYYYRGDVVNNYVQYGTYKPVYIVGNNSLYPGAASMFATQNEAVNACNDWQVDYADGLNCVDNIISNTQEVNKPMIWRIVRINEDGTIRLILDQGINDNYDYKFSYADDGGELAVFDYNDSNIKDKLNDWYNIQLKDNANLVNSSYCIEAKNADDIYNYNTTLNCSKDNQIEGKIGLLTVDEALYTGMGIEHRANKSSSYLKGMDTWLLTTTYDSVEEGSFTEGNIASIYFDTLNYSMQLSPVINLKSDITISSGNGTKDAPYVIE